MQFHEWQWRDNPSPWRDTHRESYHLSRKIISDKKKKKKKEKKFKITHASTPKKIMLLLILNKPPATYHLIGVHQLYPIHVFLMRPPF